MRRLGLATAAPHRRRRLNPGAHVRDGAQLHSVSAIETLSIGTFNLRWRQHLDHDQKIRTSDRPRTR